MSGDVIKRYVLPEGIAETPAIRSLIKAQHEYADSEDAYMRGYARGLFGALVRLVGPSR